MESISEEELLKKHRQERKELQSKIQTMKKTAPKGKKKKEVADAVAQLEQEMAERHERELSAINKVQVVNDVKDNQPNEDEETAADIPQENVRVSRAQKRRNKKVNEEKERDKRIMEQEEVNRKGPRILETNAIKELLQAEGLQLHSIPADGNCLYCAVNHQLKITDRENLGVPKLRELTAQYMRDNKEDFLPFMCNDSEEPFSDEQFEEYCKDVATSKFWGGQMELKALSNVLKCPIKVIQASGPTTIQGENFNGPPLTLTYHRHLYRLGEHYNSTTAVSLLMQQDSS